jgi:chromosomal replication initiation ATPase DnaA
VIAYRSVKPLTARGSPGPAIGITVSATVRFPTARLGWRDVTVHLAHLPRRSVSEIQKAVAAHYGLAQSDMISERRARAVARPRQVAMWLAKKLTTRSLPDIGRRFGWRDHTTVLHAVRRIDQLRAEDPKMHDDTERLIDLLGGRPA